MEPDRLPAALRPDFPMDQQVPWGPVLPTDMACCAAVAPVLACISNKFPQNIF